MYIHFLQYIHEGSSYIEAACKILPLQFTTHAVYVMTIARAHQLYAIISNWAVNAVET